MDALRMVDHTHGPARSILDSSISGEKYNIYLVQHCTASNVSLS